MLGCTTNTLYPDQWPELLKKPADGCSNISGEYCDKYYDRRRGLHSLTHLLVYGGKSPDNDEEAQHTLALVTHIRIIQSEKTLGLEIMNEDKILHVKTLTFGKDIFCEDVPYIKTSGSECIDDYMHGVHYYSKVFYSERFYLLPAEDGSLIILHTSGGRGCGLIAYAQGCGFCLLPFPVIGSDRHYHQVKKYTPIRSKAENYR